MKNTADMVQKSIQARSKNHTPKRTAKPSPAFLLCLVLITMAPFVMVPGMYEYVKIPQAGLIQCTALLILFIHIISQLKRKKKLSLSLNLPDLLFTGFMVWALVSVFMGINHFEGLTRWCHWAACGIIYTILCRMGLKERQYRQIFLCLGISGIVVAIIGICQHVFGLGIIPQSAGPAATFANKNMAAQFIILTLPLVLTQFIISNTLSGSRMWALGSALMATYLVYTGTRAAWTAATVELTAFALVLILALGFQSIFKPAGRHKIISGVAGTVVFLILIHAGPGGMGLYLPEIYDRAASIFSETAANGPDHSQTGNPSASSGSHRISIWINTLEMVKARPIAGVGLGNHKIHYPLYHAAKIKESAFSESSQLENVHNDLLQVLSETGIIGLGLVVSAIMGLVYCFIRKIRSLPHPSSKIMLWGSGISLLGILVDAQFSFPFQMPVPPLAAAVLCAVMVSRDSCPGQVSFRIPQSTAATLAAFILILLVGMSFIHARLIKSDFWLQQAKAYEAHSQWPQVIEASKEAYRAASFRVKPLTLAARAQIESGHFQDGIRNLKAFLSQYPYHMNALMNLGVAYYGLGEYRQASKYLGKALEIKPDWAKAHQNLAAARMAMKDYSGAITHFQQALKHGPQAPGLIYNLGLCHFHLKNYEKAARSLEKTARLKPDLPNLQLNLGILYYEHLGRKEQSINHFKAALHQTPDIPNAGYIRAIIDHYDSTDKGNKT